MPSILQRDLRTRRQSQFHLEALDDRIVLSAAAAGAVVESSANAAAIEHRQEVRMAHHEELLARQEARLGRVEARHDAKLAQVEARREARLAFIDARSGLPNPNAAVAVTNPTAVSGSASSSVSANTTGASATTSTTTASPTIVTTPNNSTNPSQQVPQYPVTTLATGTGTTTATGSGTTAVGALPANVSAALQSLYQEYENAGGGSFAPSLPSDRTLQISGTDVGVSLKVSASSDFNTTLSQLQSDGLQVSTSSSSYGIIDGMLPIADLPTVAAVVASVTPTPPPMLR
ncbi:MAG: hypothetical protein ACYC61_01850 [Isosphaeraceae bacterium]